MESENNSPIMKSTIETKLKLKSDSQISSDKTQDATFIESLELLLLKIEIKSDNILPLYLQ
jgi:hypothetical protein